MRPGDITECKYCHKVKSNSGRAWTQHSLQDHIRMAHPDEWAKNEKKREKRRRYKARQRQREEDLYKEFPGMEMADLIGGDLPDGAYWALVEELS